MIDFDPSHGTAYANDPDYDRMTGRVTHHSEIVGITVNGWKVRHTVTVIDLGRSAPVAADPDKQLRPERFEHEDAFRVAVAAANIRKREERAAALPEAVAACLAEHGPLPARSIGQHIAPGADRRILIALRDHPERFVYLGGPNRAWGLPGQTLPPKPTGLISPTMRAVRATLEAQGPHTVRELAELVGQPYSSVYDALMRMPDWFVVVDMRAAVSTGTDAKVWGLVE